VVRDAPLLAPCRRPILIATKYMLFRGQDTNLMRLAGTVNGERRTANRERWSGSGAKVSAIERGRGPGRLL